MRPATTPVMGQPFASRCRVCGVRLTNVPSAVTDHVTFATRRMYANRNDPPFTYTCQPCDERAESVEDTAP